MRYRKTAEATPLTLLPPLQKTDLRLFTQKRAPHPSAGSTRTYTLTHHRARRNTKNLHNLATVQVGADRIQLLLSSQLSNTTLQIVTTPQPASATGDDYESSHRTRHTMQTLQLIARITQYSGAPLNQSNLTRGNYRTAYAAPPDGHSLNRVIIKTQRTHTLLHHLRAHHLMVAGTRRSRPSQIYEFGLPISRINAAKRRIKSEPGTDHPVRLLLAAC